MSFNVNPGADVVSIFTHVPDGSTQPTWQLIDTDSNVIVAESSDGITEVITGSGIWSIRFAAPLTLGDYIILWSIIVGSTEYSDADPFSVTPPVANVLGLGGGARMPLWLRFCGQEVTNAARLISYIESGQRPEGIDVASPASGLPSILYRTSGTPEVFDDPVSDPAPWYDSSVPESAEFLGLILDPAGCDEIEAIPVRSVTQKVSGLGGGTIGPRSFAPLTLTFKGYLIGTTDCGAEYGERWLTDILNPSDPCALCDAQVRTCSPPDDGSDDTRGMWNLYNAAVTDGPHYSRDVAPDCHHIISVEFTITCEKPYLYKPALQCVPAQIIWPDEFGSECISFEDWWCGDASPPVCCIIPPPAIGSQNAIITIDATDGGVARLLVQMFDASSGVAIPPGASPLAELRVTQLETGSMLVINSARQIVHYYAPDGSITDGSPYLELDSEQALRWFTVNRDDPTSSICVSVETPAGGGDAATVQIDTQLRVA